MREDLTCEELEKAWQAWRARLRDHHPSMARSSHPVDFKFDGAVWTRLRQPIKLQDKTVVARIIVFTSSDGRQIGGSACQDAVGPRRVSSG